MGNAVDAAISSLLCVGVVNAHTSGLGGGMFMLIYNKSTGKAESIMARERAPSTVTETMAVKDRPFGFRSIAVPGELSGMWEAHSRYGSLPWEDLFEPVIRLAEGGFPVTDHLATSFWSLVARLRDIRTHLQYNDIVYVNWSTGRLKTAGDIVYAPKMGKTLRAIAKNGARELYTGETGRLLIQDIQENGGTLTATDLESYTAEWREVPTISIGRGLTVLATPSPSSGTLVQFILNILKNYNISSDDFKANDGKIRIYHRFVEASKFAFALRSYLGDANTPEVQEVLKKLQSDEHARKVFSEIRDDRVTYTNASGYDALINTASRDGGTCHISVVDQDGNAVSATSSINNYYGSGVSRKTGIVLNNHMADFDTPSTQPASSANHIAPGKIPFSSMAPMIVLDKNGNVELVVGSAGSSVIITTNAWIILRSVFSDATLQEIIEEKRLHNQLQPEDIDIYEKGFAEDIQAGLMGRGHRLELAKLPFLSVVQAIRRTDDGWVAYSDPRKHGTAAGY